MKQYPSNKATARQGVSFVQSVVAQAGSIFREYPEDTDLGVDGHIELVENGISTGKLIAVQIKSGASYYRHGKKGDYFRVVANSSDMDYWNKYPIPVILIVYNPTNLLSGWMDIKGFIINNPKALGQEKITLAIPTIDHSFNCKALSTNIANLTSKPTHDTGQLAYAELFASEDDSETYKGFLGLSSCNEYLFSKLTCFMFIERLFHHNAVIRMGVTDLVSRYLLHPEISLTAPKEIRQYVENKVVHFGYKEIVELLKTALLDEENLIQRGSIGQSAGVIITNIQEHSRHLIKIALDVTQPDEIRIATMILADEFGIYPIIEAVALNFDQIGWGDSYEAAKCAVENVYYEERDTIDLPSLIKKEGYDDDSLAALLETLTIYSLVENEGNILDIMLQTTNPVVKYEASRSLDRVNRFLKRHVNQSKLMT